MDRKNRSGFLRVEWPPFMAKVLNYEYWPWYLFFLPLFPVWLYFAIRSRNLVYFTAANPAIPFSGLFGESKSRIMDQIPSEYKPNGWRVNRNERENIETILASRQLSFPLVFKPDVGERGYGVRIINNTMEMHSYLKDFDHDVIVQEYVQAPVELGVLYHRMPGTTTGKITSVTIKEFLKVTGNGTDNIRGLMAKNARSQLQIKRLVVKGTDLEHIPAHGEEVLLEPIGNHCLGTKFIDGGHLINEDLHHVFDRITESFSGFHYGRFDLKVSCISDLLQGDNIRIFEVNGVTSEPGHIYDPRHHLLTAYRDTARHMGYVFRISSANRRNGFAGNSLKEVLSTINSHFFRKNKTPEEDPRVSSYISEQI